MAVSLAAERASEDAEALEEKGVKTWNVNVPMKDANKVLLDFEAGKARYRYVLEA